MAIQARLEELYSKMILPHIEAFISIARQITQRMQEQIASISTPPGTMLSL